MAKPLLGVNVPKILNSAMGSMMYAGILSSATEGARTGGNPGGGKAITITSHAFKGMASTFTKSASGLVRGASHTILILAASLSPAIEPKAGDTIVLTGDPELGGTTVTIVDKGVERDPASATWTCHVKS